MAGIILNKGGSISLKKETLKHVLVGLGWQQKKPNGEVDADVSLLLLDDQGKARNEDDFIFYGRLEGGNKSVKHSGDNREGGDGGDDEQVFVYLNKVPESIKRILILVTIHEGAQKGESFGDLYDSYVRLVDVDKTANNVEGEEICKFVLDNNLHGKTGIEFASLLRNDKGDWTFRAEEVPFEDELYGALTKYGLGHLITG